MAVTRLTNFLWIGLHFISILLFFYGFFSVDEKLAGLNTSSNDQDLDQRSLGAIKFIGNHCDLVLEKPLFNKMVFIVIDALRADFTPNAHGDSNPQNHQNPSMPFLEKLLNKKMAIKFSSIAQTPTVTMPRLKAILAGIKPNFLDLIMNLNAARFNEDNLVDRARQSGKKMIFFGDDTWLQMFPGDTFLRHNVTYSFFATDYIQVDTNVTTNMEPELDKLDQWDIMFLHYLGVDHIGHSFGSKSSLMPYKLQEMDSVLRKIYEKVSRNSAEPYLIVITGDHGMTEDGNHGGSSSQESETSLIFINTRLNGSSSKQALKSSTVQQIDIAATISLLLGLPIPRRSTGKLIAPLLQQWSVAPEIFGCYLFKNSLQIKSLTKLNQASLKSLKSALDYHMEYLNDYQQRSILSLEASKREYSQFLESAQSEISQNQDDSTFAGLITQLIAISLSFTSALKIIQNEYRETKSVIFSCNFTEPLILFVLGGYFLRIVLLGSTSFVEMENFYWSYFASTIVVLNILRLFAVERNVPSLLNFMSLPLDYALKIIGHLITIILLRIISSWQSYFAPMIGSLITLKEQRNLGAAIIMVSLFAVSFLSSNTTRFRKQQCILVSGLLWVYLYRCDTNFLTIFRLPFLSLIPKVSSNFKAHLVYLHLLVIMMENFFNRRKINLGWSIMDDLLPHHSKRSIESTPSMLRSFTLCWILLICLLSKLPNIPFIALVIGLERIIYFLTKWSLTTDNIIYFVVTYLSLGMSCYFSQGNSNSISTIDVASGYIGLESYQPMFTGILMASHTYSLLVFWILMMFVRITETKTSLKSVKDTKVLTSIFSFLLFSQFLTLAYFEVVSLILRNHLFIWSVISPKLLYESFQSFIFFMIIVVVTICHQFNK